MQFSLATAAGLFKLLFASCWLLLLMFVLTSLLITRFSKEGRNMIESKSFGSKAFKVIMLSS